MGSSLIVFYSIVLINHKDVVTGFEARWIKLFCNIVMKPKGSVWNVKISENSDELLRFSY